MQPFTLASEIQRRYADYIRTAFPFADPDLQRQVDEKIERERLLATGPIVALQRDFAPGTSIEALRGSGELHENIAKIFAGWSVYAHQLAAFKRLSDRSGDAASTIVATGTGSGKTEAFLWPILDYCARHPSDGVKALIVYPMNALANDQLERLRTYLCGTGITFGRYTGETASGENDARNPGTLEPGEPYKVGGRVPLEERWSRAAIKNRPPNILLTGYRMLEMLLVRREDQFIFTPGGATSTLRYFVLDEVHTYTGALGAEVACLVRRLRGHVNKHGKKLVCVGTSATVGDNRQTHVLEFGSKLFAVKFDADALVEEQYVALPAAPEHFGPPPNLTAADINSVNAIVESPDVSADVSTLSHTLSAIFGSRSWPDKPADVAVALKEEFAKLPVVAWLHHALAKPKALATLAAEFRMLPDRSMVDEDAALRELTALLILGTYARDTAGPLLRPRLHAIYRGLSNSTRCAIDGTLLPHGDKTCTKCHSRTMALEICRACGQDYYRLGAKVDEATKPSLKTLGDGFNTRMETRDELFRGQNTTVRFVKELHEVELGDEDVEDPEHDFPDDSRPVRYCGECGYVAFLDTAGSCTQCGGTNTAVLQAVRRGPMVRCANCKSTYGVNREPMTALASSTAIGVSILTWLLMGRLPEAERRLLIFADSRQDTAYQAGYLEDITGDYSWRQLTYRLVRDEVEKGELPPDLDKFWQSLYARGLNEFGIFKKERKQEQLRELRWFVLQEFSRVATRRVGLEHLGLVIGQYRDLEEIVDEDEFAAFRRAMIRVDGMHALNDDDLVATLAVLLDLMRFAGALNDEFTRKYWFDADELRGLDRYNRMPVAFTVTGSGKEFKFARIRALVSSSHSLTSLERYVKRLGVKAWPDAVHAAAEILQAAGYLVKAEVGGAHAHQKRQDVLSVNSGLMALDLPKRLWFCTQCRTINRRNVGGMCSTPTCNGADHGTLVELKEPQSKNFYVGMYTTVEPIRIDAKEHSGQISGFKREQYEREFKDGTTNVLVASPTLELGVDIGQLSTVLMRGLPPTPANYTQRAGRAGRRERIALVNAYAQPLPHDNYFYERPELMVAGAIAAPVLGLDNREIVRRHIRSLALEKLTNQLPRFMREFLNLTAEDSPTYEAYIASKIIDGVPALSELASKRDAIASAAATAFAVDAENDMQWLTAAFIGQVLERFEADLRSVIDGWHLEIIQIASEIARLNKIANRTAQETHRRDALEATLRRLTSSFHSDSSAAQLSASYTLSYLSEHGFLPSYAFPGSPATLFAPDAHESEVTRDPIIAISEFAPGNFVYVDGERVLCNAIMLGRTISGSPDDYLAGPESNYYTCSTCGHHSLSAWVGGCPDCKNTQTQESHRRLPGRYFRGHQDGLINASEEARRRKAFDVVVSLVGLPESSEKYPYQTCPTELRLRQTLIQINRGRFEKGDVVRFDICIECGEAKLDFGAGDWIKQHEKRAKHKPRMITVDLTNQFESDVVIIAPAGLDVDACTTLREALLLAAALEYDADRDEVQGFEMSAPDGNPARIVLYEAVSGGAGYIRRMAADLPKLAGNALELFDHDPPCDKACYQCLLTYRNQRVHDRLDKKVIQPFLRALAAEPSLSPLLIAKGGGYEGAGDSPETAAEATLLRAMRKRSGFIEYDPQGQIAANDRTLVSVPDFLFPKSRIAVYVDGGIHDDPEVKARDERVRARAQQLGYKIVVFTNDEVMADVEMCVNRLQDEIMDRV